MATKYCKICIENVSIKGRFWEQGRPGFRSIDSARQALWEGFNSCLDHQRDDRKIVSFLCQPIMTKTNKTPWNPRTIYEFKNTPLLPTKLVMKGFFMCSVQICYCNGKKYCNYRIYLSECVEIRSLCGILIN